MKTEKQVYVSITLNVIEVLMEKGYAASVSDYDTENDTDWE